MTVDLLNRTFYSISDRHEAECYEAVIGSRPGSEELAWLVVEDARESLIYQRGPDAPARRIAEDTYILSPHFTPDHLCWVERIGADWRMRGLSSDGEAGDVFDLADIQGRPLSISSCSGDDRTWLVWEERRGRRTRVRVCGVSGTRFCEASDVVDGRFNAYDPVCTFGADGMLYVLFCAFRWGNYHILLQKVDPSGRTVDAPVRISDAGGPCFYPSVTSRPGGGIWFSYMQVSSGVGESVVAFVRHIRRGFHHGLFNARSHIRAGFFDGERCWAPYAPARPGAQQGPMAATIVYGAEGGGHSRIFLDSAGRVRLLLRQHRDAGRVQYETEQGALRRPEGPWVQQSRNNHPGISLVTLQDDHWEEPVSILPRAHLEAPLSCNLNADTLRIGFTQDSRKTGWNKTGEWFDGEGQLGVGVAELRLTDLAPPAYDMRPFRHTPLSVPAIEEPPLAPGEGELKRVLGQTHTHTNLSICKREADRDPHINYRFVQDVQHCDFCGTTDHAYNMWHTEMLVMRKLAEYYYFPGEFVAIPAYEWTGSCTQTCSHEGGPFGHVNPLYLAEEGDLAVFTPVDPDCPGGSLPRLWEQYAGQQIVTPPHHPADNAHWYAWQFFDERFCPVVEIFQDYRGSGETPWAPGVTNWLHRQEGHWVVPQLKSGRRFGFIASADHGGVALAGLFVNELTRSGLYEAFMARRTFGTTGVSAHVDFTCNGEPMGSSVATEHACFRLLVEAPEPIVEVHILRDGEQVARREVGQRRLDHAWQTERREPGEFWYCRAIFESGEMAWSSPIWLD